MSFNEKHNESNGEENRDGESHNRSWNCGVEGETDDPAIRSLRERQKRNLLTTLVLSQGVPMLLGGDEIGRTQRGNNNAYCQDSEISWIDWSLRDENLVLLGFTRRLMDFEVDMRSSGGGSGFRAAVFSDRGSQTSGGSTRTGAK